MEKRKTRLAPDVSVGVTGGPEPISEHSFDEVHDGQSYERNCCANENAPSWVEHSVFGVERSVNSEDDHEYSKPLSYVLEHAMSSIVVLLGGLSGSGRGLQSLPLRLRMLREKGRAHGDDRMAGDAATNK